MDALRYHSHGSPPEVLRLEDLPERPLEEGEVRLKILAAPVNPADLNIIAGNYGVHPGLPATAGLEGVGEVIESRAPGFSVGDHAMALRPVGSWATQAIGEAKNLFKLPAGLDPLQEAMLKVNPATAWKLLTSFATLPEGSSIIQNAANSAVGRCVIALAKHLGIRTINLVRRPELIDELMAIGADEVFVDSDEALERYRGDRPRLAFNCVGGESALRMMKQLGRGGIHITYGAMARRPLTVPARALIFDDIQVRGLWITRWVEQADPAEVSEVYHKLSGLMQEGIVSIPVDATYPLGGYAAALARLDAPGRTGKILFTP
jgi:NADPH:quinone reductase-like Zn-dependent oxidoreductase